MLSPVTIRSIMLSFAKMNPASLLLLLSFFCITTVAGQQSVKFALLTDLHVSPGTESDSALNRIVDEINRTSLDFIIVTGDISNSGTDQELFTVKKALDRLNKPCFALPGNHETNWSESAGLTFNRLWGNDRFIFEKNGYLFVGFNTGPFMKMGDGHVKQEDLLWLKRQLQAKRKEGRVLISFSHYPLSDGLDDWFQVTDILKLYGCRIDFCGHGHRLSLLNFDGIPGIMGRSSLPGTSLLAGYNIVILRNDSVILYNKELTKNIGKPSIKLNYLKPDTLSKIAVSPMPDYSVNKTFMTRNTVMELADTASIFAGPCLTEDNILVYGNSTGLVKALSTSSLKVLWETKIAGPVYSTPVTYGGIVILGTVDGKIIGLTSSGGQKVWSVNTGRPVLAEGITGDGSVYIGGGDKTFYKIDIKTGKIIWQFSGIEGLIQGKPVLCGSSVIFGAWDTYLYCLNKFTGTLSWKWSNGKPQKLYSPGNISPVCTGSRVFIVAPDRFMTAIDLITGKEIWRSNQHQVRESMGVSEDGSLVYAKLMNDSVIAVSATENFPRTVWAVSGGFGYEHNPCPVATSGNLVIAGTRNGVLVAIDGITRKVLWKFKAGNSSVNKIVTDKNQTIWYTLVEGKTGGIKTIHN